MDFETTLKATLFFFFYSSSFCRAMMRGRAGNLFSNVLKRILINLVTQTKCFLSPSLRRRERGGETVARERENSLSLAPLRTRARVSSCVSHATRRRQRQQRCASAFWTKIFCRRDRQIPTVFN
jgi:hypothetical protein